MTIYLAKWSMVVTNDGEHSLIGKGPHYFNSKVPLEAFLEVTTHKKIMNVYAFGLLKSKWVRGCKHRSDYGTPQNLILTYPLQTHPTMKGDYARENPHVNSKQKYILSFSLSQISMDDKRICHFPCGPHTIFSSLFH